MNSRIFAIFLIFATILCFCKTQISFSTDWSGGKRSDSLNDAPKLVANSNLIVKRKPGWGKRTKGNSIGISFTNICHLIFFSI